MPTLRKVDEPDGKQDENNSNIDSPAPSPPTERLEDSKISDPQIMESRRNILSGELATIKPSQESNIHKTSKQDSGELATRREKTSRFFGVCLTKSSTNPYLAQLSIDGKNCYAGCHRLETDAAFASDKVVSFFSTHESNDKPTPKKKVNFNSLDEYKDARKQELEELGVCESDVPDLDALTSKVQSYIDAFVKKKESTPNDGVVPVERLPESSSQENSNHAEGSEELATKKQKSSRFNGVCCAKARNSYQSNIRIHGKRCYAGSYRLETDAAFAYDQVALYFAHDWNDKSSLQSKINFNSLEEYGYARAQELEESGLSDSSFDPDTLTSKVRSLIHAFIKKNEPAFNGDNKHNNSIASSTGVPAADNVNDNSPISSVDKEEEVLLATASRLHEESTKNHKDESKMSSAYGKLSCFQHHSLFSQDLQFLISAN